MEATTNTTDTLREVNRIANRENRGDLSLVGDSSDAVTARLAAHSQEVFDEIDREAVETKQKAPFVIDTEAKVNWYLGIKANNAAEVARIKAQTAQRVRELEADAAALDARFLADVQDWAEGERTRRRRQTLTLQQGTLAFRACSASLRIVDEGTAFMFADTEAPHLLKVRRDVDTSAFLKAAEKWLAETGECLPGVERVNARESFAVTFPTDRKGA